MHDVLIGQQWMRRNGSVYEVIDERVNNGLREVHLSPVYIYRGVGKGRKSWKWDEAVMAEMDCVKGVPQCGQS